MRVDVLLVSGIVAAVAAGFATGVEAVEKSGTAVAVVQMTAALGAAGERALTAPSPVFKGDVIRTGASGEAQIVLLDDTRLVVGPNSYMTVDDFVFDGGNQARKVTLNAVRGAFRFITGSSRKDAYTIKTPTATIGVRGTRFDFTVGRRGRMDLALFDGEAQLCDRWRRCVVVSGGCSVAVAQRFRPIRPPASPDERSKILASAFPFVVSQARLQNGFRVDTSDCGTVRAGVLTPGTFSAPARAAGGFGDPGPSGGVVTAGAAVGPSSPSGPGQSQGNSGFGNGGEGSEGASETGNPGQGGGPH